MSKRRDYDKRHLTLIYYDSNETKKLIFQVNGIIVNESNEAGLSAQKLAFCCNASIQATCLDWKSCATNGFDRFT